MKKYSIILFILVSFFLANTVVGQGTLQATIKAGSAPNSIYITVKSNGAATTPAVPISTVNFCIQIANTVPIKPTLNAVRVPPTTSMGVPNITDVSAETAAAGYYTWNIDAADGTTATTWTANQEINLLEVFFNGDPVTKTVARLVHIPNGGTTGASTFYISIGGVAQESDNALMYGATAVNNTNGVYPLGNAVVTLPNVALPVKFTEFNAVKRDNSALLTWQIDNESSITDHYEIERSFNGTVFKTMGSVKAKNNGRSSNSYDLTDLNLSALRSAGVFYYRIKQIDKDANYTYSEIRSVRLNSKGIIIGVYPNPVQEFAMVSIDLEQDADATISVSDATGKQVQTIQTQLFKGANTKKINMAAMAAGNYLLKIQTLTETQTISVVKTK